MKTTLTQKKISSLKLVEKEQTISDVNVPGFHVRQTKWGCYYAWRGERNGKRYKIEIGSVNDISLSEARELANQFRLKMKSGEDPRRPQKQSDPTLAEVYEEFVTSKKYKNMKSGYNFSKQMEKYNLPRLGKVRFKELSKSLLREHWNSISSNADGENKSQTAFKCNAHLATLIRWADSNLGLELETNPTVFNREYKPVHRTRILLELELQSLIKEINNLSEGSIIQSKKNKTEQLEIFSPPIKQFFMCVLLTGIRNGELRQMRWNQIERKIKVTSRLHEESIKVNIWNCPPESTKDNRPIRFVLSDAVMKIMDSIPKSENHDEDGYVFFGKGGLSKPMARPKRVALNIRCKLAFQNSWTLHDLRRTMITWLSENGESAADIDRLIGKVVNEGAASHRIYDHAQKLDVSAAIAKRWADYIGELKG